MDTNLAAAIVSAGGTTLVAITALLINSKRLDDMNKRMDDMGKRMDRIENKLEHIEQLLVSYALDVARIKEKLGIA